MVGGSEYVPDRRRRKEEFTRGRCPCSRVLYLGLDYRSLCCFFYFAHRLFFHILAAHAEFRLQRETSGPYGDPYTRGVSGLVGPVAGD